MVHAVAYILFILPFTAWLGHELKIRHSLKAQWLWAAAASAVGIVGSIISALLLSKTGNFLLHASGGISSVLLFVYLLRTLGLRYSWRITTLLLFGFVSTLGVLNELAEYAFELLGLGIMSLDSHDTWRDFVANTTGAAAVWALVSFKSKRWLRPPLGPAQVIQDTREQRQGD